jgi:hypothetical protein
VPEIERTRDQSDFKQNIKQLLNKIVYFKLKRLFVYSALIFLKYKTLYFYWKYSSFIKHETPIQNIVLKESLFINHYTPLKTTVLKDVLPKHLICHWRKGPLTAYITRPTSTGGG